MTAAGWVALAITVFGAFSYAAASIFQAVAAQRSSSTVATMKHPLYLAGIACDAMAWVGSMIALQQLAVYLVESILAGSLAITVVAARFILKSKLRRRDVAAVVVSISMLGVLALSAGPQEEVSTTDQLRVWFCAAALINAIIAWAMVKGAPAGLVAAQGGLSLGGAALIGRVLPGADGPWYTEPLMVALLLFAGTGMTLYANALQRGDVGPVTAVHWTAEVVSPSVVALIILGDTVRPGWGLIALTAGLLTIGCAIMLATAPGMSAAAGEGAKPDQPALPAPQPAPVSSESERIIWWGPPPVWTPRARMPAVLASAPVAPELTWTPGVPAGAMWAGPPADADRVEAPVEVEAGERPTLRDLAPDPVAPLRPWHDL